MSAIRLAPQDIDKPPVQDGPPWITKYTGLHFKSRRSVYVDLIYAASIGDTLEFGYLMHQWQDSYVHYDRGYRGKWGHWNPSVDDRYDSTNVANHAYERCDATTRQLEDFWIASTFDYSDDMLGSLVSLRTNPWMRTDVYLWITDENGNAVHIKDY